jgi:hypothetical protein
MHQCEDMVRCGLDEYVGHIVAVIWKSYIIFLVNRYDESLYLKFIRKEICGR